MVVEIIGQKRIGITERIFGTILYDSVMVDTLYSFVKTKTYRSVQELTCKNYTSIDYRLLLIMYQY